MPVIFYLTTSFFGLYDGVKIHYCIVLSIESKKSKLHNTHNLILHAITNNPYFSFKVKSIRLSKIQTKILLEKKLEKTKLTKQLSKSNRHRQKCNIGASLQNTLSKRHW